MSCWLAANGKLENGRAMTPCDGRLIRAHLIKKQVVARCGSLVDLWDDRLWVWACGGPMGNGGHHGMLDVSKKLRIPRDRLPAAVEAVAAETGLTWWLDREYGS